MSSGAVVRMFVNGMALSGGPLNGPLERSGRLIGKVRTSSDYRFWSCRDEFPGLYWVSEGGWSVPGEVYELDYAVLRDEFLPLEPPELELGIIKLEDGSGSLSMRYRDDVVARADELLLPIPPGLGWLEYLDSRPR